MAGGKSFEWQFDTAKLNAALVDAKKHLGGHMKSLANESVELAKEGSPVGTPESTGIPGYRGGTNRRSVTADYSEGAGGSGGAIGEDGGACGNEGMPSGDDIGMRIYTQSGYGGYLEIGTSRMPARPYIVPGFTSAVDNLMRALEGSL
jgi:hypothetical protein